MSAPTFFLMKLSDSNFATLLVDSAENIMIAGSYKHFSSDYFVVGSDNSSKVRELTFKFAGVQSKLDSLRLLSQKHQNVTGYSSDIERWNNEYAKQVSYYTGYLNDFIKRNPFSMASVFALYQKWGENNYVANDFPGNEDSCLSALCGIPKK